MIDLTLTDDKAILRAMADGYDTWPLSAIPTVEGRMQERDARLAAYALAVSTGDPRDAEPGIEIVSAPGCYSEPYAPTEGWLWSRRAAEELTAQECHMPGGSSHRHLEIA